MDNESITYTNKFSVISDAKKNEFILTFYQEIPKLDENFKVSNVETKNVGTLVMSRAMFTSLCNQISKILEVGEKETTEKNV